MKAARPRPGLNRPARGGSHGAPAELVIRRVRPADAPSLRDFYERLSPESRRSRFLGWAAVSDGMSLMFCTPDHVHGEGFLALAQRATDGGPVVGHLCLEPAGDGELELAVAVADEWQGRGVGRALMAAALRWAADHGYQRIVATCFADNWRVLRLLSEAAYPPRMVPAEAGVVEVTIPLTGPLPAAWSAPPGSSADRRGRPASRRTARPVPLSRPCRVVWRRTPPPARGAAG